MDHPRRCTARRHNGQPCRRYAARGATVCRTHGGAAPQVQAAAKRRLQQATDALAAQLLNIALDDGAPESVRLAAIRDALDRGGVTAKAEVEVEVGVRPFEQIFAGIDRGLRRDGTREPAPSLPAPPALAPATVEIVDAEVVDMPAAGAERPYAPTAPANERDARKRPPPWAGEKPPPQRPGTALQTLEAANADLARDGIRPPARRRRGRA